MRDQKRAFHMVSLSWAGGKSVTFYRDPGWSRCYARPSQTSLYRLVRAVRRAGLEIYPLPAGWSAKQKSS